MSVSMVLDDAKLHDHGILLEYQLPMSSKRLDCMITGQDEARRDNLVTTFVGGRERDLLHPLAQVLQYQRYLEDSHTAFYGPPRASMRRRSRSSSRWSSCSVGR